jgi:uncharacterized membrane protein
MQISAKQYRATKLAIVLVLAVLFSQPAIFKNLFISIPALVVGSVLMIFLRRHVKDVIIDERDYATAGKASAVAIQLYAYLAVIGMFVFYSLSDRNPYYEAIGMTLAFSTVILLLTSAAFFHYYNKFKFTDKKFLFTVIIAVLFFVMAIATLRVFSGEDDWMCQNGEWVKHGNPSFPAPNIECK